MKHTTLLAAGFAVGATSAFAGGMDRSGQSIAPLFESGDYVELSFGNVSPNVSGTFAGTLNSGNMTESYVRFGFAYKRDLNDKLSMAVIMDQPFGASVKYGSTDTGYPYSNAFADVSGTAITALLRYKFNDRMSVHGGLRALKSKGEVGIPVLSNYTMETSSELDLGYVLGAAYEIPEIALRAALTYNSAIDIEFDTTEMGAVPGTMDVTMPQSVNLDFQTGIAADTLLMASVRWAEWTETTISPSLAPNLVTHDNDVVTYSLGVGRRFNDQWSGSLTLGHEKSNGGIASNLSPTDGFTSLTAGVKYQVNEQTAISGGISYAWLGDATTDISGVSAEFTDNHAVGVGLKISHNF